MAVIRDPMPAFELFQPTSVADAQMVLRRYGATAWVLAGGLDSLDWLKDRIKRPEAVVDLCGIPELKGIRETGEALEIGATTTLTEVVRHPVVRAVFDPPRSGRSGSVAGSQPGHYRRQRLAGHALLVLTGPAGPTAPAAASATPIRRIDQPRTCHPRRRPLRGGQPV